MASVDVLVPCYQYGRYLRDAVTSILSQRVDALRVLVIDNGSTDNTLEVARQLGTEDNRVQVIAHSENLGQHAGYNAGLDRVSADYCMLLDADDVLGPGCLRRAVDVLEQNPRLSFCYGLEIGMIFEEGMRCATPPEPDAASWTITPGKEFIERFCRVPVNTIGATTVVRRTSVQKKIGHYSPQVPHANDFEMWLRLATAGDVAYTAAVQGIRRIHGQQLTAAYRADPARDVAARQAAFLSFFSNEGHVIPDAKRLHRMAQRNLAKHALWDGLRCLGDGDEGSGNACLKFAFALAPAATIPRFLKNVWRLDHPFTRLGTPLVPLLNRWIHKGPGDH
jgi:glycosyltransferase involved in cell wall biosynthesis